MKISPIEREYSEHVIVVLIDFKVSESRSLLEKLRRKLSTNKSLNRTIEKQIEHINQFNMYVRRDMHVVFSNVRSKYLQIISRELLKCRNSQLAKQGEDAKQTLGNQPDVNLMEIPFFKYLEEQFQGFDWKDALPLLERLNPYFGQSLHNEGALFAKMVLSTCVKSYFMQFISISRRHSRNDKANYYRFSMYFIYNKPEIIVEECFNTKLESEHLSRKNEYPIKVILLIGKHSLEWREDGFVQISETGYQELEKASCFHQSFLVCRKAEDISHYLNKVVDFNCKWNASMFFDPVECNSGHYVKSLLSYMNLSLSNNETKVLLDSICENGPIPLTFTIPADLVMMSNFEKTLSTFVFSLGYEPNWIRPMLSASSQNIYDYSFKFTLERNLDEIQTFYNFIFPYLSTSCPYFDVSQEFGHYLIAILESNRTVLRGDIFASLLSFSKENMEALNRRKLYNESYHSQIYNFSDYKTMKNSIEAGDVNVLNDISEFLQ